MLYLNKDFEVINKELEFGTLRCIELGANGKAQSSFLLPVSDDVELIDHYLEKGLYTNLTIKPTKSGKPKIEIVSNNDDNKMIYVLLDSHLNYNIYSIDKNKTTNGKITTMPYEDFDELISYNNYYEHEPYSFEIKLISVPNDDRTKIIKCEYVCSKLRDENKQYSLIICKKDRVDEVWNGYIKDYYDMNNEDLNKLVLDKDRLFEKYELNLSKVSTLIKYLTDAYYTEPDALSKEGYDIQRDEDKNFVISKDNKNYYTIQKDDRNTYKIMKKEIYKNIIKIMPHLQNNCFVICCDINEDSYLVKIMYYDEDNNYINYIMPYLCYQVDNGFAK